MLSCSQTVNKFYLNRPCFIIYNSCVVMVYTTFYIAILHNNLTLSVDINQKHSFNRDFTNNHLLQSFYMYIFKLKDTLDNIRI